MKKITILGLLILGVCTFFTSSVSAFESFEEIDSFYDNQLEQVRQRTEQKKRDALDQMNRELEAVDEKYKALEIEVYKEALGDHFDKVKDFLPISNPDPEYHARVISTFSPQEAIDSIRYIRAINPDLADQIQLIYDTQYKNSSKNNKPLSEKSQELANELFQLFDLMDDKYEAAELFASTKDTHPGLYAATQELAMTKYFSSRRTPQEIFAYMDTLPLSRASFLDGRLHVFNQELQDDVRKLAQSKYPDGKSVDLSPSKTPQTNLLDTQAGVKAPVFANEKPSWIKRVWRFIFGS